MSRSLDERRCANEQVLPVLSSSDYGAAVAGHSRSRSLLLQELSREMARRPAQSSVDRWSSLLQQSQNLREVRPRFPRETVKQVLFRDLCGSASNIQHLRHLRAVVPSRSARAEVLLPQVC